MFLPLISIDSCMIIHYIMEEKFFSLLFAGFHYRSNIKMSCHIKDCFKINGKQTIKMRKKG